MTELILNMILIVLAVFGLYCLVRLIFDAADHSADAAFSFRVASREELRELPERLRAACQRLSVPRGDFRILVPLSLYEDESFRELLSAALLCESAEIIPYLDSPDTPRV